MKAMLNRLGYVEEDKHFVPGVNVRAASIEKLAMLAVECFSKFLECEVGAGCNLSD